MASSNSGQVCTPSNSTRCPGCVQSRCLHQWREIAVFLKQCACGLQQCSIALTVFGCFRRQCIVATPRIPLDRIGHQTALDQDRLHSKSIGCWSRFEVLVAPCRCGVCQIGITVVSGYVSWARSHLSSTSQSCCCVIRKPRIVGTLRVTFVDRNASSRTCVPSCQVT